MPEEVGTIKSVLGFTIEFTGFEYTPEFITQSKWINDHCLKILDQTARSLRSRKFEDAIFIINVNDVEGRLKGELESNIAQKYIAYEWGKAIFIGGTQVLLYTYDSKGRYLKELKEYDKAIENFKKAKIIYEAILHDRSYENLARDPELGGALVGDKKLRILIRFINRNNSIIKNNDSLAHVKDSIPEFMLGYAGLMQSKEILKPEEAGDITEEELNEKVSGLFQDSAKMIKNAEKNYEEEFIPKYLKIKEPRSEVLNKIQSKRARGITLSGKELIIERIELKLQTSKVRLELAKANYLLEVAKRIRSKNFKFAKKIVDDAISIVSRILQGKIPNRPPQEVISALLTLAWGYSSKAALLEDEEKNKGVPYATVAAAIYRAMLHGVNSLDQEMLKSISSLPEESLIFEKVKTYIEHNCGFIAKSLRNIIRGGQDVWWHGTLPHITGVADVDVLALLTNNELELSLTHADNLRAAGRFDEAIAEYNNILNLERKLSSYVRNSIKETIWFRAESGKANALVRKADNYYLETGDFIETRDILTREDGAVAFAEQALAKIQSMVEGVKQGATLGMTVQEECHTELIKAADTLGWAYDILGRLDKEEKGTGKEYFEKVNKLYQAIHYLKTEGSPKAEEEEFNKLLEFVSHTTLGMNDKQLMEVKIETNFTDARLHLKRADALKNLKEFDKAIAEYEKIAPQDIVYTQAKVGIGEAEIGKAKYEFTRTWDRENSVKLLEKNISTLHGLLPTIGDRILKHRVISALAWAYSVKGDIEERLYNWEAARENYLKAGTFYQILLSSKVNAIADTNPVLRATLEHLVQSKAGLLKEEILKEAGTSKLLLRFNLAQLLKAVGKKKEKFLEEKERLSEKEKEILEKQEEMLKKAISEYNGIISSYERIPENNPLSKQARVRRREEAVIGRTEAEILLARVYDQKKEVEEARNVAKTLIQDLPNIVETSLKGGMPPRIVLKWIFTLSWAYGTRGGLEEEIEGPGMGREYFLKAALLYKTLLDGQEATATKEWKALLEGVDYSDMKEILKSIGQLRDALLNEELLEEAESSIPKFHLTLAELLKAAGSDTESLISLKPQDEAQEEYKKALNLYKPAPESKFYMRELTEIGEAKVGLAESLIVEGKIREENNEFDLAKKCYHKALKLYDVVMSDNHDAKLNLRAVRSLAWAFGSIDGLEETRLLEETGEVKCEGYYIISAVIYETLKDGKSSLEGSKEWGDICGRAEDMLKKAQEDYNVNFKDEKDEINFENILSVIKDKRRSMLNPVVLDELDLSRLIIEFDYILNLIAAKRYDQGREAFKEVSKKFGLDKEATLSIREEILRVATLIAIADVYCWKEGKYGKAQEYYLEALKHVEKKELAKFSQIGYSIISAHFGLAHIYAKRRKFEESEEEYRKIISFIESKKEKKELRNKDKMLLAKAYIGIADLYNYFLKDAKAAMEAYDVAMDYAEAYPLKKGEAKLKALIWLGKGDVHRLIKAISTFKTENHEHEYEEAMKWYKKASEAIASVNDQDGAKIKAGIAAAVAAAFRGDWKEGLDFDRALILYELAEHELENVCHDDIAVKRTKRMNNRDRKDAIIERARRTLSAGASFENEKSKHESKEEESGEITKTRTDIFGRNFGLRFTWTKRTMLTFNFGHGKIGGTEISMDASDLINREELYNPYITLTSMTDEEARKLPFIRVREYGKQDIQNGYDAFEGQELPLLETKSIDQYKFGINHQKDYGRVSIHSEGNIGLTRITSDIFNYWLNDYPNADSLDSKDFENIFKSTNVGGKISFHLKNLISERWFPDTLSVETGGNVLFRSEPYGTFPLDRNEKNSKIRASSDELKGAQDVIAVIDRELPGMEERLVEIDKELSDPNLPPARRNELLLEREELTAKIEGFKAQRPWAVNRIEELGEEIKKLQDELDDLSEKKPLVMGYLQAIWSITIPYELMGTERDWLGYGLTFNFGLRYAYDEISPTWNGFWPFEGNPHRTHLLAGVSNKFYLPWGIVAPLSVSSSLPRIKKKEDGINISTNLDFIFTSVSRKLGITPELNLNHSYYIDNANKSNKFECMLGVSLK